MNQLAARHWYFRLASSKQTLHCAKFSTTGRAWYSIPHSRKVYFWEDQNIMVQTNSSWRGPIPRRWRCLCGPITDFAHPGFIYQSDYQQQGTRSTLESEMSSNFFVQGLAYEGRRIAPQVRVPCTVWLWYLKTSIRVSLTFALHISAQSRISRVGRAELRWTQQITIACQSKRPFKIQADR